MALQLFDHQRDVLDRILTGSILCGGTGSGKSITALYYWFVYECSGKLRANGQGGFAPMKTPRDLYIITTAMKRDKRDWDGELAHFPVGSCPVKIVVDSWNNIKKYVGVKNAFFIFDEQRLVGAGTWVKSFLKIAKENRWILLSATPGDTWIDYIPVFIANGFYRNRTEFLRRHVVYHPHSKYPKILRYEDERWLMALKNQITIVMEFKRHTISHFSTIVTEYDTVKMDTAMRKRWHPYENRPIKEIGELCYILRRVANSDPSRTQAVKELTAKHPRIVIFYNFNYELEALRALAQEIDIPFAEWNGAYHQQIPPTDRWLYLVQYTAGCEGWNCTTTDATIFFSQNYSYKVMHQAAGRIDRLNTPFVDLYYYTLRSDAVIDLAIAKAIRKKQVFNEHRFTDI